MQIHIPEPVLGGLTCDGEASRSESAAWLFPVLYSKIKINKDINKTEIIKNNL